jgi:hypothetical protein
MLKNAEYDLKRKKNPCIAVLWKIVKKSPPNNKKRRVPLNPVNPEVNTC